MHYYEKLPEKKKETVKVHTNPPFSDTFRLNNLSGGKFIPVGYTMNSLPDMRRERNIEDSFSRIKEKIPAYSRKNNIKIQYMVADYRMMPSLYGAPCYESMDTNLAVMLYKDAEVLLPTFTLELPCYINGWIKTLKAIEKNGGYNVKIIKFLEGQLVKKTKTNQMNSCYTTVVLHS